MRRSKRSKRILHERRQVSTRRPMHVTTRLCAGLPSLRTSAFRARFKKMIKEARSRGVDTIAYAIMGNHLHWLVIPRSRDALHDATRYVFGQLGRWLNDQWGRRRGQVFSERYHSRVGKSVRQAWQTIGYILRNPRAAGIPTPDNGWDPFVGVDETAWDRQPFLHTIFGPISAAVRLLLWRMTRAPVPFTPRHRRLQPVLPGLT